MMNRTNFRIQAYDIFLRYSMRVGKSLILTRSSLSILLLILSICGGPVHAQPGNNPLKGDLRVHDPVMIKQDGRYHLYYSVSAWMNFNSSIGYATNTTLNPDDPDYNWVDQGKVISYKNGGKGVNVIDPITPSLGEGVFIIEDSDYHYILASRGRCCSGIESTYQIVMGRSKNVHGPYSTKEGECWQDNKYSLFLEGEYDEPGRGHNGFFFENDTTFIVYHAYTRSAEGASLLNIQPLLMDEDRWPTLVQTLDLFRMKTTPTIK